MDELKKSEYEELLVKERIKGYPEKPYSEIVDIEYDLELGITPTSKINLEIELEILKNNILNLNKKIKNQAFAMLVITTVILGIIIIF